MPQSKQTKKTLKIGYGTHPTSEQVILAYEEVMHLCIETRYAPNFEKVGSILVSACAFVRSSVCPFKTEFKLGF